MAAWKNRSEMKIVGVNLGILISYTILVNVVIPLDVDGPSEEKSFRVMWLLMFLIGLHMVANMLIALVLWLCKRREPAGGFFLGGAVVLVIGFSLCWGGAALTIWSS